MIVPSLIKIADKKFDSIMESWVANINISIFTLHLNEDPYFNDNVDFHVIDTREPDREFTVLRDIKNTVRTRKKNAGRTILLGYDTQYLPAKVLDAILVKARALPTCKNVGLHQITASRITELVDHLLYEDYYIPDLIFVVIEL